RKRSPRGSRRTRHRPPPRRKRAAEPKAKAEPAGRSRFGGQPTAALRALRREGGVFASEEHGDCERDSREARGRAARPHGRRHDGLQEGDRKSTRLNSSHLVISYAVFCLKKKNDTKEHKNNTQSLSKDI